MRQSEGKPPESAHALRGDQEQLPLRVARTVSAKKSANVCVKSFAILDIARLTAGKRRHHCSTKSWKRQDDWEVNSWLLENDNKCREPTPVGSREIRTSV